VVGCKSSFISKDNGKKIANSNIFPSIILPQENPPNEQENHNL
jgi:hypothetical protein